MKKTFFKNRRAKYGGIAVLLTVLLLVAVLLANTLVGTLAARYGWYAGFRSNVVFPVGEKTLSLVGAALDSAGAGEVQIHFCNSAEELKKGSLTSYIYQTATEFAARDARIKLVYHDIVLDPQSVAEYRTVTRWNSQTGKEEEQTVALQKSTVIVTAGSYCKVIPATEFFLWENGSETPSAYQGEKKFASAVLRAVAPESPVACLTSNHGETYYDGEILYLLEDAGYRLQETDLSKSALPAECSLLICFNPNNDLAEKNGVADVSESEILDSFLSVPGHSLLVFMENGTPELPNWDAYLSGWGIAPCYAKDETASYRYMMRNEMDSLTSDGYTIPGRANNAGMAAEFTRGIVQAPVFSNATGFTVASGFMPTASGNFEKGNRRVVALYESGNRSVAYANGKVVSGSSAGLIAYGEQTVAGGVSRVAVVFSVQFATEELLSSAAYGNTDVLLRLVGKMSGIRNAEGVAAVAFPSSVMHGLTRGQRMGWVFALVLLPAAAVTAVAIPVLVRRKHA